MGWERNTLRITGRDTAQTERILMRLVNTSSIQGKECLRVNLVLTLYPFLLSLPVSHATIRRSF